MNGRSFAKRIFLALSLAIAIPSAFAASPLTLGHIHILPSQKWLRDHRATTAASTVGGASGLATSGGPTMPASHAYAIYWLPAGYHFESSSTGDASYMNLINRYLTDVGNSSFYNIVTQYPGSAGATTNAADLAGSFVDATAYSAVSGGAAGTGDGSKTNPISDGQIQAEISKVMASQGWTPGPDKIFYVFTGANVWSHDATGATSFDTYCGYHGSFRDGSGNLVIYSNMPDNNSVDSQGQIGGCQIQAINGIFDRNGNYLSPNNDLAADAEISILAHEQIEAATDPAMDSAAWGDSSGNEIGDKCNGYIPSGALDSTGADVHLNGHAYIVQSMWSNAQDPAEQNGCSMAYSSVLSVSPSSGPAPGGSTVSLTGIGFTGATSVKFGSLAISNFTVTSDKSITVVSPPGTGKVDISVIAPGGPSALGTPDLYTYTTASSVAPVVTGISVQNGPASGNTTLIISGSNFTGATAVMFGKNAATSFTVNSDTQISAISPPGQGTVDVTVVGQAGPSATGLADQFAYVANQTISFSPAPTIAVGGTGAVSATASSGLSVTFASLTPSVCTVSGNTVTSLTAGTCTISASQAGNTAYGPAQANLYITISNNSQSIGAISFSPETLNVGASATASAASTSGLAVNFTSLTPAVCSISGSTVNGLSPGVCMVAADQPGNGSFSAATQVTQSIIVLASGNVAKFAYAVNSASNSISIMTINPSTGVPTIAGTQAIAGKVPYGIATDPAGKFAYAVNYVTSDVSVYAINQTTGSLTPAGTAFTRGNPNAITVDPSGRYVYVADKGVSVYAINQSTGALTAKTPVYAGSNPAALAVDPTGRFVYVVNYGSNSVSAFAINQNTGDLSSLGASVAAGTAPVGITVDPSGRFAYVTNSNSNTVSVYSIDQASGLLKAVSTAPTGVYPFAVAVDPTGRFAYVADSGVSVYAIDQTTGALTAGTPVTAGTGPTAITVDPTGKYVYVANWSSSDISAFTINQTSGALAALAHVTTGTNPAAIALATSSSSGPATLSAQTISFVSSSAIAVNGSGTLSASASSGLGVTFTSLTPSVCTVSGSTVTGVSSGNCVIAANQAGSTGYSASQQVTQTIVIGSAPAPVGSQMGGSLQGGSAIGNTGIANAATSTLAGAPIASGTADGVKSAARFYQPWGLTTDGINLYVADAGNNTIRKTAIATGEVTTLAGSPGTPGALDGTGSSAKFSFPIAVATDGTSLYVADSGNNTIRKVTIATGQVTTLAGKAGVSGSLDGTGASAQFSYLSDITTDGTNLYVLDANAIRMVTIATGQVTTLAGVASTAGYADGTGSAARFNYPAGITTDGTSLYVSDGGNTIRKVAIATGAVTTIAGTNGITGSADGTGSAAQFNIPYGLATDGTNLYIADSGNTVRKLALATGAVTTIAGKAGVSGSADGIGASAQFNGPTGVTTDGTSLYVTDYFNNTVRQIASSNAIQSIGLSSGWNLVGNGLGNAVDVAALFGDSTRVTTVWKWEAKGTNPSITYPAWAFYTPLQADGGAAYAASHGYDFLTTVNPGEGFWVNAKTSFAAPLSGNPVPTSAFADSATGGANALPSGWSLISVGDNPTPSAFNKEIGATPPATGTIPTNLTTIWAWDAVRANWYFYAPSLDANGGLSGYITSKKYLDFGTMTLAPTTGFWVNHP